MAWTEELVAEASRLWKEGRSATEIGATLNLSRNAVIGKLHRLGFTRDDKPRKPVKRVRRAPVPRDPAERPRPTVAPTPGIDAIAPAPEPRKEIAPPLDIVEDAPEATDLPPEDRPDRIGILDLRHNSCRWPLGDVGAPDFGYCGHLAIEGRPYCPDHHAMATRQPGRTISEEQKRAISLANKKHWARRKAA